MGNIIKKTAPPPPKSKTSSTSPDKTTDFEGDKQHFSSLLRKSEQEKPLSKEKVQRDIRKGLDSVQKRLANALSEAGKHVDDKERAHEHRQGFEDNVMEAALSDVSKHLEHTTSSTSVNMSQAASDAPSAARDIGKIAQQIANQIMATPPGSDANPEVRIRLKTSVLDGSDVRIFRQGGELMVVFVANSKDAENFIMQNKEQLQQTLAERLKDERIQISVEQPRRDAAEEGHNEGRSRQEYFVPDEEEFANDPRKSR